ncbi:MAG: hypothetical protein FWH27_19110 [Planctomycetaceae bacterium]|nr:hypothetical protein [Planctomycetaceae bacterium]
MHWVTEIYLNATQLKPWTLQEVGMVVEGHAVLGQNRMSRRMKDDWIRSLKDDSAKLPANLVNKKIREWLEKIGVPKEQFNRARQARCPPTWRDEKRR